MPISADALQHLLKGFTTENTIRQVLGCETHRADTYIPRRYVSSKDLQVPLSPLFFTVAEEIGHVCQFICHE